jgi:hypothetical protein
VKRWRLLWAGGAVLIIVGAVVVILTRKVLDIVLPAFLIGYLLIHFGEKARRQEKSN